MSEPTVETEIARAKQAALDALGAAATEIPRRSLPEVSTSPVNSSSPTPRTPAQLEKRSHEMSFQPMPQRPQEAGSSAAEDLREPASDENQIPPPPGGTVMLGAIDGVLQWFQTDNC